MLRFYSIPYPKASTAHSYFFDGLVFLQDIHISIGNSCHNLSDTQVQKFHFDPRQVINRQPGIIDELLANYRNRWG